MPTARRVSLNSDAYEMFCGMQKRDTSIDTYIYMDQEIKTEKKTNGRGSRRRLVVTVFVGALVLGIHLCRWHGGAAALAGVATSARWKVLHLDDDAASFFASDLDHASTKSSVAGSTSLKNASIAARWLGKSFGSSAAAKRSCPAWYSS
jgi:hypothetical protein